MKQQVEKLIEQLQKDADAFKMQAELYRHNKLCRDMFYQRYALYNQCLRIKNKLQKILDHEII